MTSASQIAFDMDLQFEGRQSASQFSLAAGATALSIVLLTAQAQHDARARYLPATPRPAVHSQETAHVVQELRLSERDLISALVEFHDRLLASQADLAPEASRVLKENLWKLYE